MAAKPVSFYLALPDGTCFIYPADEVPIPLQRGYRPYIDNRLYEVEEIIPCLSAEPGDQQVLHLLKRLRNVAMPKMVDLGPKKSLIVEDTKAVLVLLKEVSTKTNRLPSLRPETRLRDDPAETSPTGGSNEGNEKK
jgi:hypothetical protein